MKAKTKLQKQISELSLPQITEKQKQFAFSSCLDKWAMVLRGTTFCTECGHSWKCEDGSLIASICGVTCPSCGVNLQMKSVYANTFKEMTYFAILTTKGGFQVVRMLCVTKTFKRGAAAVYDSTEVMQHWITKDGKTEFLSMLCNGFSMYYDQWCFGTELEFRGIASLKAEMRRDIAPFKIYPNRRILPEIKRNGFKGHFHGLSPHHMFSTILSEPYAETLLKAGQISLFQKHSKYPGKIRDNWASVKICIRNNYIVKDAGIWTDYIDLLAHFGKDLRSPKYICPENLIVAHDRLSHKKREQEKRIKIEKRRAKMEKEQLKYEKQKANFFGLQFVDGEIQISTLASVEEFMNEGDTLGHCVYTNKYYEKAESLIMSARIEDKPIETIEINLHSFKIEQSRGKGNKATEYHKRIVDLVQANIPLISKRITA